MSNRPSAPHTDRPTATYPTGCPSPLAPAQTSPFADRRDQAPTEPLPAVPAVPTAPTRTERLAERRRAARRAARRRHLRAALTALALAAAILTGLQLYAAQGISQARQAALTTRSARDTTQTEQATSSQVEQAPAQTEHNAPQPTWVTEDTGAPYNRTDPAASPLDLPRCTTSPSTPLPCLATVSPNSTRAVVLEEDASLTALTRR